MTNSILKDMGWTQKNSDFLCGTVHKTMMLRKLDDRINIYEWRTFWTTRCCNWKQSTAFPWDSLISALALIASWITIFLLLKERAEKNRPYMQVSFELIRGSLACIVIRNTGSVPLEKLRKMRLQPDFVRQLPDKTQQRIAKKEKTWISRFSRNKNGFGVRYQRYKYHQQF